MNSKKYLFNEAERIFIYEYSTVDEVADKLNLNRKTIMAWKDEGDWDKKRKDYLKSKQSFHEELYEFARKLMKDIASDMDLGEKVDPGRMYAFCKIIPMFAKVKDYEDIVTKKDKKEQPRGLTPELVSRIEEEVLGIPPNDTTNNKEDKEE